MTRRLRGYLVSGELVAECIRKAIPQGAEFFRAYFDEAKGCFVVIFEWEGFAEVPEGCAVEIENK